MQAHSIRSMDLKPRSFNFTAKTFKSQPLSVQHKVLDKGQAAKGALKSFTYVNANDFMSVEEFKVKFRIESNKALDVCFAKLSSSLTARALVDDAMRHGWAFDMADQGDFDFHIDVEARQVLINNHGLETEGLLESEHFQNMVFLSLVRALRDVWQENRDHASHERFAPEQVLMVERVRAADADVMAVLVAWELRNLGMAGLWRHLIGSDESDIAMSFAGYLDRNPYETSYHEAMRVAFDQWYRNEERVRACDHETLDYIDDLMQDFDEAELFGSDHLRENDIVALSCLPDRTAYLQHMGREILMDPFYAGMSDEINQAHFSQILYDLRVFHVEGVPFRDKGLASKIFPQSFSEQHLMFSDIKKGPR